MRLLQIILSGVASLIVLALIVKYVSFLWKKVSDARASYERIFNSRLDAYQLLNNSLQPASVTLKKDESALHGCMLSMRDYTFFRKAMADVERQIYWYTSHTSKTLKEYLEFLDQQTKAFGLTKDADDALYQQFGIENYQTLEEYHNRLLEFILDDYQTIEDVRHFLADKNIDNIDTL